MKKRKTFARGTDTWQLFEHLFFLTQESYPKRVGPLSRGKAVNMTQGLNCCNIQWAESQGMPLNMLQYSAKAVRGTSEADWSVEISTNYRQQGLASPQGRAKSGWMLAILDQAKEASSKDGLYREHLQPGRTPSGEGDSLPRTSPSPSPAEPEVDACEDLLHKLGY